MNHDAPFWHRKAVELEPAANVTDILTAALTGRPAELAALPAALAAVLRVDPARVVVERRHEAITLRLLPAADPQPGDPAWAQTPAPTAPPLPWLL